MKWRSTLDRHVAEEGIYSAECFKRFVTETNYSAAGGWEQEKQVGWTWRVLKDGKPWKRGNKRLLTEAKKAAEQWIDKENP